MKALFCKSTALFLLRSDASVEAYRRASAPDLSHASDVARVSSAAALEGCPRPLHILAERHSTSTRNAVFHSWGAYAPDRQLRLVGGLPVLGPELLMLDFARDVDLLDLALLGFELCGTYRLRADGSGFASADPLTTPRLIARCADRSSGVTGVKTLRAAARHVLPAAASPMEAALVLLLCLPRRLGGLALPAPLLNHRIDLGSRFVVCDAYWPAQRVALEYDSDRFHAGAERLNRDAERRTALLARGVTVVSVTRDQVYRPTRFDELERALRKNLGVRGQARGEAFEDRQRELRRRVLGIGLEEGSPSSLIRFGR
ncbi:MAG: hypothetical protein HFJ75_10375 [Eggerthellaceae bacterium]|nr:hypothetical protein [Eggerthellaceae bacterium]